MMMRNMRGKTNKSCNHTLTNPNKEREPKREEEALARNKRSPNKNNNFKISQELRIWILTFCIR
jgi:hypothetical protein